MEKSTPCLGRCPALGTVWWHNAWLSRSCPSPHCRIHPWETGCPWLPSTASLPMEEHKDRDRQILHLEQRPFNVFILIILSLDFLVSWSSKLFPDKNEYLWVSWKTAWLARTQCFHVSIVRHAWTWWSVNNKWISECTGKYEKKIYQKWGRLIVVRVWKVW